MTIATNDSVLKFGTRDTVDSGSTSAVNDGAMAVAGDVTTWTNDDDAPGVNLVLNWQYPSGTLDGNIEVYARPLNIEGTADQPQPDAAYKQKYVGTFYIDPNQAATTDTPYTAYADLSEIATKSSQEYEFYPYNDSGVQMTAGWTLKAMPLAIGPHA